MKPFNRIILLTSLCFIAILFSCEPPDDDPIIEETSTVFEERFLPGFFRINGEDVLTNDVSSTNYTVIDELPASRIPDGNLFSFSVAVAIPTDSSVQIEPELDNVSFTRADDVIVPPFFEGSNFRSNDVLDGISYSLYDFNFTYPSEAPTVEANTIKEFKFIVTTDYFDRNSGEFLEDIIFNYTINVTSN